LVKLQEANVTANSPCAIYNFYNCCGNGNGSSAAQSAPFIWHSGLVLDPTGTGSASTELLEAVGFVVTNRPNAALKAYWGLTPLHKKAQLKEIMLLRLPEQTSGPAYTATINFDLVVMDFNGVFVRQISTVALDFRVIPLRTWTPITLSAVAG
jgi:hypothetical protein